MANAEDIVITVAKDVAISEDSDGSRHVLALLNVDEFLCNFIALSLFVSLSSFLVWRHPYTRIAKTL
jgi:hypothetical protein